MNPLISWLLLMVICIVPVVVVLLYALRTKGDVMASLSLRPFTFTLNAKDRVRIGDPQDKLNR